MEMQQQPNEWDEATTVSTGQVRRAAWFVWGVGLLQTVFSGCGTAVMLVAASMPIDELIAEFSKQGHDTQALQQMGSQIFTVIAATLFFLGFLPGLAYLILGFFVQKANRRVMEFTALLLLTQSIVIGILFVVNLLGSLVMLDPMAVTSNVLFLGTPLAMLIYTWIQVQRAKQTVGSNFDVNVDPWGDA